MTLVLAMLPGCTVTPAATATNDEQSRAAIPADLTEGQAQLVARLYTTPAALAAELNKQWPASTALMRNKAARL